MVKIKIKIIKHIESNHKNPPPPFFFLLGHFQSLCAEAGRISAPQR